MRQLEPEKKVLRFTRDCCVSLVASALACSFLEKSLREGKPVRISSLGITIEPDKLQKTEE